MRYLAHAAWVDEEGDLQQNRLGIYPSQLEAMAAAEKEARDWGEEGDGLKWNVQDQGPENIAIAAEILTSNGTSCTLAVWEV